LRMGFPVQQSLPGCVLSSSAASTSSAVAARLIFTAAIYGDTGRNFGTPETSLRGKRICVTGQIREYQGKPEIVLTEPSQMTQQGAGRLIGTSLLALRLLGADPLEARRTNQSAWLPWNCDRLPPRGRARRAVPGRLDRPGAAGCCHEPVLRGHCDEAGRDRRRKHGREYRRGTV
jgi:hypothetical protein